jgi:hypothetical protein
MCPVRLLYAYIHCPTEADQCNFRLQIANRSSFEGFFIDDQIERNSGRPEEPERGQDIRESLSTDVEEEKLQMLFKEVEVHRKNILL